MNTQYIIRKHRVSGAMCRNNQFLYPICSGMGSKDTLIYKRHASAIKKLEEVKRWYPDACIDTLDNYKAPKHPHRNLVAEISTLTKG